ncbi:hypothetical protein SDC9_96681 [bioreactor metagenome]|uniref:NTF2 fold domain-containing protein n=1 Tax=bioreactor metagenome TaxID=1076179 RepID=A0A645AAB6_9ZZZZ
MQSQIRYSFLSAICLCILSYHISAQTNIVNSDSVRAIVILKESGLPLQNNKTINQNGFVLNLSDKKAKRIAIHAANNIYGFVHIFWQKPFHKFVFNDYYIIWGNFRGNRFGGVFECIVNKRNGGIEYLNHGK